MRVYVYPADKTGCGHYRGIWPAQALQRKGYDVRIVEPSDRLWHVTMAGEEDVVQASYPRDADVIVFQRTTHRGHIGLARYLRRKGVAVVLDVDDDMVNIHQRNVAWAAYHPRNRWREADDQLRPHSWHHITRLANTVTYVTVSSSALLTRYVQHGRGCMLLNYLPRHFLDAGVEHKDSNLLGWPGALYNHPNDPQVTRPAVRRLTDAGYPFVVCGNPTDAGMALGLEKDPEGFGDIVFNDWPWQVSRLGVGIVPLAATVFNDAKSWLKGLELMGAGVPWVASPRAEYLRLHSLGVGFLADKPKEWYRVCKRLLDSPGLREEQSGRGLEVARRLVIDDYCEQWWEAWTEARKLQDIFDVDAAAAGDTGRR